MEKELATLEKLSGASRIKAKLIQVAEKTKEIGQDDPRKIVHSLKVGLALTLVSLLYYLRPLYNGFGMAGMWAVLTVVVVFEFSVGATLCKGLNRGFATLLAGALGVGADRLASLFGDKGAPVVLGFLVFLLAAAATFIRFFPHVKARYDYGMVIFILTFNLVAVSGYPVGKILELAHHRLSTIIIGGAVCVVISTVVWPVWAGEDLHNLIALNIGKLGSFLEGFGDEYFKAAEDDVSDVVSKDNKPPLADYKSVLTSKTAEESLANFAWWEPCHGRFRFRHPWKQYLKVGTVARQCANRLDELNGYITSDVQLPSECRRKIEGPCARMSSEAGKALKELSSAVKNMTRPTNASTHIHNSKLAVDDLKTVLAATTLEAADLLNIIPAHALAHILTEVVQCVDKIADSINELSHLARFKRLETSPVNAEKPQLLPPRPTINPVMSDEGDGCHVVITVAEPAKGDRGEPLHC